MNMLNAVLISVLVQFSGISYGASPRTTHNQFRKPVMAPVEYISLGVRFRIKPSVISSNPITPTPTKPPTLGAILFQTVRMQLPTHIRSVNSFKYFKSLFGNRLHQIKPDSRCPGFYYVSLFPTTQGAKPTPISAPSKTQPTTGPVTFNTTVNIFPNNLTPTPSIPPEDPRPPANPEIGSHNINSHNTRPRLILPQFRSNKDDSDSSRKTETPPRLEPVLTQESNSSAFQLRLFVEPDSNQAGIHLNVNQ